jgi:peptidoglycan/LPS O-acetylase OafA/YrhL
MNKKLDQNFIFILRFLAILCVIIDHSAIYVNQFGGRVNQFKTSNPLIYNITEIGTYGVYFFFIISGYCLSYSFFLRKENGYKFFYIRRIFRIVPLYFLLGIFFYFIFRIAKYYFINEILLIDNAIYNFENIVSNLLFIHGFVVSANNNVVPGGWSIANEMFYYALFPLLVYFFNKNNDNRRLGNFFNQLFLFLILVFILQILNTNIQENNYLIFIFNNTINPVIFFIFGIILFNFNEELRANLKKTNYYLLSILSILFIINFVYANIFIKHFILIIIFLFIFLFLEQFQFKKKYHFFLIYGKASYGAYLAHFFILEIIGYFFVKKYLIQVFSPLVIFFITLFLVLILTYFISRIINIKIEKKFINFGNKLIVHIKKKI